MENRSSATRLRLRFITDRDSTYDEAKSKIFEIEPNSPKKPATSTCRTTRTPKAA